MAVLVMAPAVGNASLPRLTVDPDYRPPIPIAEILALEEPSSHNPQKSDLATGLKSL
jgi:hypothetical protein